MALHPEFILHEANQPRTPIQTPAQTEAKHLGLKALQRTDQEGQMSLDAKKKALAEQEQIKAIFQQGLSPEETLKAIQRINPATAQAMQKALDEHGASQAKTGGENIDTAKKHLEMIGSAAQSMRQVPPEQRQQAWLTRLGALHTAGVDVGKFPTQAPDDIDLEALATSATSQKDQLELQLKDRSETRLQQQADTPNTPFEGWQKQNPEAPVENFLKANRAESANTPFEVWHAQNPDKSVDQWLKLNKANAPGEASSPFKLWERQHPGGSIEDWFKMSGPSGDSKPPTAAQLKMLGFYQRVDGALDVLDSLEPDVKKMGIVGQTRLNNAPNIMQSSVGQRYNQAKNDFINASLRRESGAAISDGEYKRFNTIYFVQPGDDGAVLAQKKKARDVQLKTFKTESGRAYTQAYGEDEAGPAGPAAPKVGDVQDGHVFMGGNPADPKSWKKQK